MPRTKKSRAERKALPTRNYLYGAATPVAHLEEVNDQMFKAARYRNALVELERERRDRSAAIMKRLCPEVLTLEKAWAALAARRAEAEDEVKENNVKARARRTTHGEWAGLKDLRK